MTAAAAERNAVKTAEKNRTIKAERQILMKKTLSMIYRFVFILFSVWGICRKVGFSILAFSPEILNFTLFIDLLCFLCIFVVFIVSITRKPGRIITVIKTALTLCAVLVFLQNLHIIRGEITYDWILGILLPVMMLLDWLLFDQRGSIRLYDPLIWLAAAALIFGALAALLKKIFGVDDLWKVLGMFADNDGLKRLLLQALGVGAGLYIADCIGSALSKRSFNSAFSLIYRLVFLALELYAFLNTVGRELTRFIYSLRYYELLSNFLCAVCIAVVVIYNLVKFKSLKKNTSPFPRLKAAFMMCILVTTAAHLVFCGKLFVLSFAEAILYYIAPVMMLFDWVLFDKKGCFRLFDPFLWLLMPLAYFCAAVIYLIPYTGVSYEIFTLPQPEMLLGSLGVILAGGYIIYIADKVSGGSR